MLVFFIILSVICVIFVTIMFSTIELEVEQLNISNYLNNDKKRKVESDFCIKNSLKLFKHVKIFKYKITDKKLKKWNIKQKLQEINFQDFEKIKKEFNLQKDFLVISKNLKPQIKKLNLILDIGTENVILTSMLPAIISTVISVLLANLVKKYTKEDYKYIITPIYENKNLIKLKLNCIIQIEMIHIIYIIYILLKKERSDKYAKSSNRRAYGYSYE